MRLNEGGEKILTIGVGNKGDFKDSGERDSASFPSMRKRVSNRGKTREQPAEMVRSGHLIKEREANRGEVSKKKKKRG